MTNIVVKESPHTRAGRTCPAAMGFSFAAGTTDGESIDHCFLRQQSGLVLGTKTSLHAGVLENVFSAEQCAGEPARLESCVCIFMSLCSSCFSSFCFTSSCFLTCVHPLLHVKLDRLKFVKSTTWNESSLKTYPETHLKAKNHLKPSDTRAAIATWSC